MESFRVGFFGHWNAGERGARELAKVVVHVVRESGAHFVRAWAPLDDIAGIRALEDAGFRIADVLTSFGADPSGMDWSAEPAGDVHVRQAKAGDEAVLAAIARDTFTRAPDRFHADPAIPAVLANDLYAEWIANSVRGRAADRVFVGCLGVDVVGFTTVLVDREPIVDGCGRTAGMPLVGVAREAQGHGCARGLIRAAIAWMAGEGIGFAHIGTQANNLPMQRVLPRIGLRLFQVGPSLHLWLSGQ
jgi:GNAT superfamily N-acetyltransferase